MPDDPKGTTPKKWAGKYDSPEEMEQGLGNLVSAFDDIKREAQANREMAAAAKREADTLREMMTRVEAQTRTPEPELDDRGVQQYIDHKIGLVEKKFEALPGVIRQELNNFAAPWAQAQQAKSQYLAQNPDYDDQPVQRFLAINPGINKVFTAMVSNPETAEAAYKYVHDTYKNSTKQNAGVNEERKRDAGAARPGSGPPPEAANPEAPSLEKLHEKSRRAQNTQSTEDELDFARAWFEGSKVRAQIEEMKPDWARD